MRASTVAVVEAGGRLARVSCEPPLTLRQVQSEIAGTCALCLVGTAAGPLAGDELSLALTVGRDARATLQATGASLAQGAGGTRAMHTCVQVAPGGRLDAHPAPVVVAAPSRVDVTVSIDLAADAAVAWHEVLVLGRTDEAAGAVTMRWDVTCDARPVLRQFVDLASANLAAWPGMLGGARMMATSFLHDPSLSARTYVHSPTAVVAKLGPHSMLATVLGASVADVRRDIRDALSGVGFVRS